MTNTQAWGVLIFALLIGALGVLVIGAGVCGCGSGTAATASDLLFVGTEADQQKLCVDHFAPDKAKQDSCRSAVKAVWDAYWRDHCDDGGTCR